MARSPIPDALARRYLLERKLPAAQALKIAEAYLEQGRALEAVDFFRAAEAVDRLEALCAAALREGDAFLLRAACGAIGREPRRDEWLQLAEAARGLSKQRYVAEAERQAGVGGPLDSAPAR